jgi:alkanesulfonate monooxygenase SsuD/methylene tetrahydromethanopterin reductase-like flavin-dependent oxidoreductase (luciferase family)
MTAVTCPIDQAYHPAVTGKGSAILGLVSGNRFTLGLGAGERLNEHDVGALARHGRASQAPIDIQAC